MKDKSPNVPIPIATNSEYSRDAGCKGDAMPDTHSKKENLLRRIAISVCLAGLRERIFTLAWMWLKGGWAYIRVALTEVEDLPICDI